MNLFKILIQALAIILLIFTTKTFARAKKNAVKKKIEPLVLQMQVSHLRNTDQISLIFKKNTLTLVTNYYSHSSSKQAVRLGQFQINMTLQMRLFKRQIQAYKRLLDKDNPDSKTSKSARAIASIPHAYQIGITGDGRLRTISTEHSYFAPLKRILMETRQNQNMYRCISCATYYKNNQSIIRIVKKQGKPPQRQKFSKEQLQCRQIGNKKLECVDEAYGLFEI